MAITPATLIAAKGLMTGAGLDVSSKLTGLVNTIQSNPLVTAYSTLSSSGFNVASLPQIMQLAGPTSTSVMTQAKATFGGSGASGAGSAAGIGKFVSTFNGASSFGSITAEYHAALQKYGSMSFGDLGINMSNYTDIITNGTSSITKGFGALASKAKEQAFGALSSAISDKDLVSGNFASEALSSGLKNVGEGLKNFGTLFDFRDLNTLGPKNMIRQLQKQGLAQKYGIDDLIFEVGYDPKDLSDVPDSYLKTVLSNVSGDDLQRIIRQNNVKITSQVRNLSDLLVAQNILPPQATQILGLAANAPDALKKLGNTLSNLGTQVDNFSMANLLESVETQSLKYLENLKQLIPTDISAALKPLLGSGSGPFGNMTMKDMLAAAGGLGYNDQFRSVVKGLEGLVNTKGGQDLLLGMETYNGAVATSTESWEAAGGESGSGLTLQAWLDADPFVTAAKGSVDTAISNIGNYITGGLESLINNATDAITSAAENIVKEAENLINAGVDLAEEVGDNIKNSVLSFAEKLDRFGVDKQNLGYNEVLENVATDDLYGDAIKAKLIEGRNTARATSIGSPNNTPSDTQEELSKVNSAELDNLKKQYMSAAQEADRASKDLFNDAKVKQDPNGVNERYEVAQEKLNQAKQAMDAAARSAKVPEGSLPKYKSNNTFN
jgi:hypothetical protein